MALPISERGRELTLVSEVFDAAMSLMDELSGSGEARTARTEDYAHRAPGIVNTLLAELRAMTGECGGRPGVRELEDPIPGASATYARSALPYGLAAALLVDENPNSAAYFQDRYEELRNLHLARLPAELGFVSDLYGGVEYGQFSSW